MYNLIYTTYDGLVSVVLCHESKEFLEELIDDVLKYNVESIKFLRENIGPFDSDYIHKTEIEELENNISKMKNETNAYIALIDSGVDVNVYEQKYEFIKSERKAYETEMSELIKKQTEHIDDIMKKRDPLKKAFSKTFRPEVLKVAERYTVTNLKIERVKHFNEF